MKVIDRQEVKKEMSIVPAWAMVVAPIIFVVIPICFWAFVWQAEARETPLAFRIIIPFVPATLLAFLVLMIGYVNRDAGRRGMSRTLWTLIVIFVPNAIGFILYFLLRAPLQLQCPKCGAKMTRQANYCSNCRHAFYPTCPQCKTAVRETDAFCVNCGVQLGTPSEGERR
jgi:hypothetical protein